jgi:hypothetical protein
MKKAAAGDVTAKALVSIERKRRELAVFKGPVSDGEGFRFSGVIRSGWSCLSVNVVGSEREDKDNSKYL